MNLVTLDEAKEHLIVEHDADDLLIADLIGDASFIVLDYIGTSKPLVGYTDVDGELLTDNDGNTRKQLEDSSGTPLFDTAGKPSLEDWPPSVEERRHPLLRRATLLVISNYYLRGQDDPISGAVESILRRLRMPVVA